MLGYEPRVKLDEGLAEVAAWLESQAARTGSHRPTPN